MSDPLKELDDDLRTELIAINQMAFKGGEQFALLQSMLGQAELAIEKATAASYNGVGRTMKLILPLMRARGKYLMEELSNWMAIMSYLDERSKEIEAILGTSEEGNDGVGATVHMGSESDNWSSGTEEPGGMDQAGAGSGGDEAEAPTKGTEDTD